MAWTPNGQTADDTAKKVKYTVADARRTLNETPQRDSGIKSPVVNGSAKVHPSVVGVPVPLQTPTGSVASHGKRAHPSWGIEQIQEESIDEGLADGEDGSDSILPRNEIQRAAT